MATGFVLVITTTLLVGAGHLIGTQATGAGVDAAGSTVDNRLNAFYVGLPCAVGTLVGVRNLNTESDTLLADIAFCHMSAPT